LTGKWCRRQDHAGACADEEGAHVPLHHHHNEQVTYILEGALKFASRQGIVVRAGEVL